MCCSVLFCSVLFCSVLFCSVLFNSAFVSFVPVPCSRSRAGSSKLVKVRVMKAYIFSSIFQQAVLDNHYRIDILPVVLLTKI